MNIQMDPARIAGQGYVTRNGYIVLADGSLGAYVGTVEVPTVNELQEPQSVPEPSTLWLLLPAVVALLVRESARR